MTLRLYRTDPLLRRFTARIVDRAVFDSRPALILDRTAFYPASGGQACDLGTLHGVGVVDVVERDDGQILHVLAADLPAAAGELAGEIDWPRRFDHMQQHTGQHILSQAFVAAAELDTIAVHLGSDECTLDLPSPRLDPAALERAEAVANQVIYDDRPVTAREVTDAEVAAVPLRRPPKVTGLIRIVEVEGFDWSACGGTHVASTGQVGLIRAYKAERRGAATRVYFHCGARALGDYRRLGAVTDALVERFSLPAGDLPRAVDRLRDELKAARKDLAEAHERLLEADARALLDGAAAAGACRLVAQAYAGRGGAPLKAMAKRLTAEPAVIALLGSAGDPSALCFARSKDAAGDMGALLRSALGALGPGAKGGGSPDFAQGGGVPATLEQVEAALACARAGLPI